MLRNIITPGDLMTDLLPSPAPLLLARLPAFLAAIVLLAPEPTRADEPELVASAATLVAHPPHAPRVDAPPAPELVAEALFLRDDLPPGGRDVNLSVGFARGEPDAGTGESAYVATPRLQLAMALGERVGFTADVGLVNEGADLDAPGASLKVLLRAPAPDRTGIAASLDLLGSAHAFDESEAGFGVGAIRSLGPVALRAAVGGASGVASWTPHLHGGFSAALALGSRWRVLGEVVADGQGGALALGAGPTVKVALGEHTALMAGALFQVEPAASAPTFALQLTSAL
jgi:hypothetical protein